MANKVGPLIKEARTGAGLTQEQLAKKIEGLSASDISKAERGEKELTQAQLKAIAKITGVTQASLLNAAKEGAKKTEAKKTDGKKTEGKKTDAKKTDGKKKTSSKKEEELKLTNAEKKLVELYRAADKDTKEAAVKLLKGEKTEAAGLLSSLLGCQIQLKKKKMLRNQVIFHYLDIIQLQVNL